MDLGSYPKETLYRAALRMYRRWGRFLSPGEMRAEGFAIMEAASRDPRPPPPYTNRALILDYDGTLRKNPSGATYPSHPDEVQLLPGRRAVLRRYRDQGWPLLGVSNQSAVSRGETDLAITEACFARTNELLGLEIPVLFCPHPRAGQCLCRKPMPGHGVQLVEEHRLAPGRCLFVGDRKTDAQFAHNLGFEFRWADEFFNAERARPAVPG